MANRTWNNPIDKNVDWGGDASTGYLPVSGEQVQKFIKDTLNEKFGCIYYDTVYNRYLIFADEDTKDSYLSDPTQTELVLGTFDAPFNYTATITLVDTSISNIVKFGSKGNYIKATFDTLNKAGVSVGETHTVNVTFRNGSSIKSLSRQVSYGSLLSLNIDDYLMEGSNAITIQSIGNETLAATSQVITFNVINLELTDYFSIANHYGANDTVSVNFSVKGNGIKHMIWNLDGALVEHNAYTDDITSYESQILTRYIQLSFATPGRHNLQFRCYVDVNGTRFYTDTHYRDFVVNTYDELVLTAGFEYPTPANGAFIDAFTSPIQMTGTEQYVQKDIKFGIYNPLNSDVVETITYANVGQSFNVSNNEEYTYSIKPLTSGNTYLVLSASGATSLVFNVSVAESDYELYEVSDCVFRFNGTDRTNNSSNRNQWSYSGHSASFSGFTWNDANGWVGDGLLIGNNCRFAIDYAPLANFSAASGGTVEFHFDAQHVLNPDAQICDLRTSGTGILIKANEVSITSRGGVTLSTKFKSGEDIRVSFVINRYSVGNNKGLAMIYVNGILSGTLPYSAGDNFISNATISFVGTDNAYVKLKQILTYSRPLTSNEILNNYILYKTSFEDLINAYDSNDIYTPNTESIDIDKVTAKMPAIIITGNLEELQNTTDKNKEVLMQKIEIINMDNPQFNLVLTDAIMRPQGTSSMSYPKKNFRIYSQRGANTKMYDYQGNEVIDRLYAFKPNAQRVNTWCLKADYAESSSSHNTGVARLWNDVLKNVKITNVSEDYYIPNTQYVCRTIAQQTAINENFSGDVRTCVDGFPICLFYHLTENDPLIFVGKYNFNNDKSTESVYGFCDIPNFDNSHVECWEVKQNGDTLALFEDVSNFESRFSTAFESRYPDDAGKPSEATRAANALKTFCTWVNSTMNDEEKFADEKWAHLDVYKIAAYYVYLMRFGAVDQVVKNAMLTTEDGYHWFYINYDNDTIFGVRNDGLLKFDPYMTRQTKDPSDPTSYCYAGHDSVLWNNLEADDEFMGIVKEIDLALYNAGLTYASMIDMFNVKQSGKWGERLFNIDEQYKYLDVWNSTGNNQLEKLQGSRESHREWWISERFGMYDEINLIGSYRDNNIEIKPTSYGVTGATISIRPSSDGHYYGYGINNAVIESGVSGDTQNDITFVTPSDRPLYVGDPIRFFNAKNIGKFDASLMAPYIQEATFSNIRINGDNSFLNDVILGSSTLENNTVTQLGSLSYVTYLKNLDVRNYKKITNLNLLNNPYIENVDATGCELLTAIELPNAAPLKTLALPENIQTLILRDMGQLPFSGITFEGTDELRTIIIQNCPSVTSDDGLKDLILDWNSGRTASAQDCTLKINGINWTGVSYSDVYYLGQIADIELGGHITLTDAITLEQMAELQVLYGQNCFDPNASFYFSFVTTPISGLTMTLSNQTIGKNDSIVASVTFSGTDFRNGYFSLSDTQNLSLTPSGFTATVESDGNVTMKTVAITYTIIRLDGTTVSIGKEFSIVPYSFYLNQESLNDTIVIPVKYNNNDTAITYNDDLAITCDDSSLTFTISAVTISGGTATFSGNTITSIVLTSFSDEAEIPVNVALSFGGTAATYSFYIKTSMIGKIVKAVYNISTNAVPTQILSSDFTLSNVKSIKVDGSVVPNAVSYLFTTNGYHDVDFEFKYSYNLEGAFKSIDALYSVNFSDLYTSFGHYVISDDLNLVKIVIDKTTVPTIQTDTFYFTTESNGTNNKLCVPQSAVANYSGTSWTTYLINASLGKFTAVPVLGWTGDENIKARGGSATVYCVVENNTGKQVYLSGVTTNNTAVTTDNVTSVGFNLNVSGISANTNVTVTADFYTSNTDYEILDYIDTNNQASYFAVPFDMTQASNQYRHPGIDISIAGSYRLSDYLLGWSDSSDYIVIAGTSNNSQVSYQVYPSVNLTVGNSDLNTFKNFRFVNGVYKLFNGNTGTTASNISSTFSGATRYGIGRATNRTGFRSEAGSDLKIQYVKLYDQTNLIYDLVPVRRISDGKIGMYDNISGNFYSSESNVEFTGGSATGNNPIIHIPVQKTDAIKFANPIAPLVFYNDTENEHTILLRRQGSAPAISLEYTIIDNYPYGSYSGMNWNNYQYTHVSATTDFVVSGGSALAIFTDEMTKFCSGFQVRNYFTSPSGASTAAFKCEGGIDALVLNKTGLTTSYAFYCAFAGFKELVLPPKVPYVNLTDYCYFGMFNGCTNLTTTPELPATTLTLQAYREMFSGCTNLTTVIGLPATTLAQSCYSDMFRSCSKLETPPELPVTTLDTRCYENMFRQCVKLKTTPVLPATSIPSNAYTAMFYECSAITSANTISASTLSSDYSANNMFHYCQNLTSIEWNANRICTNQFAYCTKLNTLIINRSTAPTINTNSFSNQGYGPSTAGYNSGTENILYTQSGATGFDTSAWTSTILDSSKGKFTISYTL